MEIFPLGTNVYIGGRIEGKIVGVAFYLAGSTMYLISYWYEGKRIEIWICPEEFQLADSMTDMVKVGFK